MTSDQTAGASAGLDGSDASVEVVIAVQQMYGRQLHAIDRGDGAAWAATFTYDGEFHSPSYDRPSRGRRELTEFGDAFALQAAAAGQVLRHVLTNLHVVNAGGRDSYRVSAYLSIVLTDVDGPRILRMTAITDDVVHRDGLPQVARRCVAPDISPASPRG